ncbi:MAG: LemA family protein [Absicoccus sp.]|uniref:LemA family protein n=1 Tax=Absicoccus intestinalis TaxID=2926319 RepID=A0ABU4WJQ3_9FIRM|nr:MULTISPECIES: LemA family protein [unclassified Absicoccus]MDX8416498.1 LemA family protein [Absicoccus sp. CLA-KB-P134]MDY3035046.1 LemA family protein [Absicoccus sp.]
MTWIIILIIVVLIVLIAISAYNKLIRMRNKVDESYATMDVYLKKRFDLIPNLVATVKGYAKHEADTLEKVIAQRGSAHGTHEILDSERAIGGAIRNLFAVAESYPDLKANQNFMDLQGQLKKVEEDIANARKYYNAVVREYNDAIMTIPTNIIASLFHFEKRQMFEVDNENERQNVKVEF